MFAVYFTWTASVRLGHSVVPNEADTCRRYVVPRLQAAGWDNDPYRINEQVTFTDEGLLFLIHNYTREAGLRNLEREVGSICRKVARGVTEGNTEPVVATPEKIRALLLTSERTIDRKSADEKEIVRDALKPEDRNSLIQFEKEKADRLAASARLLYDMAKIALGALLTCLTQMINAVVVAQRRGQAE